MIFGGTLSQPLDFSKTTVWENHEGQRQRPVEGRPGEIGGVGGRKCDENKSAVSFTRAQVKDSLNYFGGTKEFRKRAVANI
jgi:hypothetical protein